MEPKKKTEVADESENIFARIGGERCWEKEKKKKVEEEEEI